MHWAMRSGGKSPDMRKHVHGVQEQRLFLRTMQDLFFYRKSCRTTPVFKLIVLFHRTKPDRRPDAPTEHTTHRPKGVLGARSCARRAPTQRLLEASNLITQACASEGVIPPACLARV